MQTVAELEVTEVDPSPVVVTVAANPTPEVPLGGRLEMFGVVGTARWTAKVWDLPLAAEYFAPSPTWAVSEQVPTPT